MTYTQQEIASMLLTAELVTKCSHCHNTFDFGQAHMGASAKTVEGLEKPIFDEVDKQHAAFTEMKTESDPTESLKKSAARSTSITTGKIMSGLVTLHNDYPFSSTRLVTLVDLYLCLLLMRMSLSSLMLQLPKHTLLLEIRN